MFSFSVTHNGEVVLCSGCKHKGKLYVSGGFRGPLHGHISQFCCYDAGCDTWQQRAPLTRPRSYHSMASVHDHIIVAGGVHYRGEDVFDDLLVTVLKICSTITCRTNLLQNVETVNRM